jgi:hypothetical protein
MSLLEVRQSAVGNRQSDFTGLRAVIVRNQGALLPGPIADCRLPTALAAIADCLDSA